MPLHKVVDSLVAIPVDDGNGRLFVQIPCGTLINVTSGTDPQGFVQFDHVGESFTTFMRDLEAHTELVSSITI
jgi:hypothetical protein